MRVQALATLLLVLVDATPLSKPLTPVELTLPLHKRGEPADSDVSFTLFTSSTPACDRHQASYHTYSYSSSALGTCQEVDYEIGSPYRYLELDQLPADFPTDDVVLRLYTDSKCQFSEDEHKLADLEEGQCTKTIGGKSLKVLRVVESKATTAPIQGEDTDVHICLVEGVYCQP